MLIQDGDGARMCSWHWASEVSREVIAGRKPGGTYEARMSLASVLIQETKQLRELIRDEQHGDIIGRNSVAEKLAEVRMGLEHLARTFEIELDHVCEVKTLDILERWPEARAEVLRRLREERAEERKEER